MLQFALISELPPALRGKVEALIADYVANADAKDAEHEDLCRWDDLLDEGSDRDIVQSAQALVGKGVSIGLLNWYPDLRCSTHVNYHLLLKDRQHREHPRTPCLALGSLPSMEFRSGGRNHLAGRIFRRWVRMSKLTAFTNDEWIELTRPKLAKLSVRFNTTYHFHKEYYLSWFSEETCVFRGKRIFVSESEMTNLKAMLSIIKKISKLEDRVSAMQQWRIENRAMLEKRK